MITKQQVENAQNTWGDGVVKIGSLKEDRSECEDFTNKFLDEIIPLNGKSHSDVQKYSVIEEKLDADGTYLIDGNQFAGYLGEEANPTSLLFKNDTILLNTWY